MKRRIYRVFGLALLLTAITVSAAEANIVIGQSIAGLKLGDSRAKVEKQLGKGKYCETQAKSLSCAYGGSFSGRVTYNTRGLVTDMWTGSCTQRTAKGIHAGAGCKKGSSLAAIKKAYPAAKCTTMPNSGGFSTCDLHTRERGRKVDTNFLIKSAAFGVAEIDIS